MHGLLARYDINCRWGPRFAQWVEAATTQLAPGMRARAQQLRFPLPPWHHFMHVPSCQRENSARSMLGAGRGAGEPPEMAWAYIGAFGLTLQYCSLALRAETLERIFSHWNEKKLLSLPAQLQQMFLRAELQRSQSGAQLRALQLRGHELGLTPHQASACSIVDVVC